MVFQDPHASLNPRMTVARSSASRCEEHGTAKGPERRQRVEELLSLVGLEPKHANRYPHEFSGRTATANRYRQGDRPQPRLHRLRRADRRPRRLHPGPGGQSIGEPPGRTRAHLSVHLPRPVHGPPHRRPGRGDVSGQDHGTGHVADMYATPKHPYTRPSSPRCRSPTPRSRRIVADHPQGDIPSPVNPPSGCVFNTRCPIAQEKCRVDVPEFRELASGHWVACHFAE
jgi:oligopeptide/dipeptide ABC transporter ATP-binding protein